ncbi:unnamed protein product [Effrenium voratum]|nr:unnamed protein product [Effrenium voratum]
MLLGKGRRKLLSAKTLPSLSLSAGDLGDETVPDVSERRATDSNTHGDWVRRAPPGDVFYRSLPWSFGVEKPKRRRSVKGRRKATTSETTAGESDPFKDWAKEFMHLENMTLFQRKLRTLEGINSLHTDMKIETKRFRQFMQDLVAYGGEDQERLMNNRILYTEAGMKALRQGQQRNEALRRKSAWQSSAYAQKFAEREKQLFGHYGLGKQYEKGVDIKVLRRLMEESPTTGARERGSGAGWRRSSARSRSLRRLRRRSASCLRSVSVRSPRS